MLLEAPFSEFGLRKVIFYFDAFGALGLDDFSFLFYQHFFDLIKHDLLSV
jgi:hypothetical protein